MEIIILLLIGVIGGFLAGMLGVGGGIIFIPILTYFFEKEGLSSTDVVKATLANSLFLVLGSGVSGTLRQLSDKSLNWMNTLIIGLPGGAVSYLISQSIATGDWYKPFVFQLVFLVFLKLSILKMLLPDKMKSSVSISNKLPIGKSMLVGVLAGAVVAVSGLGGGIVMVPLFQWLFQLDFKQSSRLSLSVIPLLAIFPLIQYLSTQSSLNIPHTGFIAWSILLPTLLGVLVFAPIGIKVSRRTPTTVLRITFALLTIIILIKTLYAILH
mgnify:CR=1 FL=1